MVKYLQLMLLVKYGIIYYVTIGWDNSCNFDTVVTQSGEVQDQQAKTSLSQH